MDKTPHHSSKWLVAWIIVINLAWIGSGQAGDFAGNASQDSAQNGSSGNIAGGNWPPDRGSSPEAAPPSIQPPPPPATAGQGTAAPPPWMVPGNAPPPSPPSNMAAGSSSMTPPNTMMPPTGPSQDRMQIPPGWAGAGGPSSPAQENWSPPSNVAPSLAIQETLESPKPGGGNLPSYPQGFAPLPPNNWRGGPPPMVNPNWGGYGPGGGMPQQAPWGADPRQQGFVRPHAQANDMNNPGAGFSGGYNTAPPGYPPAMPGNPGNMDRPPEMNPNWGGQPPMPNYPPGYNAGAPNETPPGGLPSNNSNFPPRMMPPPAPPMGNPAAEMPPALGTPPQGPNHSPPGLLPPPAPDWGEQNRGLTPPTPGSNDMPPALSDNGGTKP